ncbi:MAG TPA: hypothetical protein PK640_18815 [Verrucomicrobiota bacterium]|nr:hypothetical protein [Verrucomicrobiota bacterium]
MSPGGHAPRLASLTRDLLQRWHQARDSWADAKAREFEERFIREIESEVNATLPAIEQLESVLQRVRQDCE